MDLCDIFLEKQFFEKYFFLINIIPKTQDSSNDSLLFKISFAKIHWYNFYMFNLFTTILIWMIILLMTLILIYIIFSKVYLKGIIVRLKNQKLETYS